MGFENFPQVNNTVPEEKPNGRVDFNAIAEKLNPEISKLEKELSELIQRAAAIKRQMGGVGNISLISELSNTVTRIELLKEQIGSHPDFGSTPNGYEINFDGRDYRFHKKNRG